MFVDDILGKYEERYFGKGHKNTSYELVEGIDLNDLKGMLKGVAKIAQYNSWSHKKGTSLKQHLSTIDGIILATMIAEDYIDKKYKEIQSEKLFLSTFDIKAGVCPIEDLENIPLLIKTVIAEKEYFDFRIDILGMRVQLVFKQIEANYDEGELPKTTSVHYHANHLKNIKNDLENIVFLNSSSLECDITRQENNRCNYSGISSLTANSVSLVEWLVVFSQLGQLLAYNFDNMKRQDSETLWMRRVKARITEPFNYHQKVEAVGRVSKALLLTKGAENWRMFDMVGCTTNQKIHFEAKVAHVLPQQELLGGDVSD